MLCLRYLEDKPATLVVAGIEYQVSTQSFCMTFSKGQAQA